MKRRTILGEKKRLVDSFFSTTAVDKSFCFDFQKNMWFQRIEDCFCM